MGSTLVVGDVGKDMSAMPRSNMELRGLDRGELGTEDGANSEGFSESVDQRGFNGMEALEAKESLCLCETSAGAGEARLSRIWDGEEKGVDDMRGAANTLGDRTGRFFLGFLASEWFATW